MKKRIIAVLLAAVTVLSAAVFSSCSGESEYPVTAGNYKFEEEPEKIVVLSKNLADIISLMGYDVKLAGRSDEVNMKGLAVVPSLGAAADVSAVSIVDSEADVVFADDNINYDTKRALEKQGTPVIIPKPAAEPKEIKKIYRQIGTILGGNITGKEAADKAFNTLYDELSDVKNAIDETKVIRTVAYLYIEDGKLRTANKGTWSAKMLDYTGAVNVFGNEKSDVVNLKTLILSNPDYIFCADMRTVKYLRSKKTFLKKLSAVRKNIHIIPRENINSQGNIAMDTIEKMLRYMFPEEFE